MFEWQVKNLKVLNLHPFLIGILGVIKKKWGIHLVTSGHRPGDTGVHGTMPSRGADLRCWHEGLGHEIEAFVNAWWVYDKDRPHKPVCVYHDAGSGLHLHLQVHPNTRKRKFKGNGRFPR